MTNQTRKTRAESAEQPVHVLNASLGWYIADTGKGHALFNEFGYAGLYATLNEALRANAAMSVEPSVS
jgi:hypothetical protein